MCVCGSAAQGSDHCGVCACACVSDRCDLGVCVCVCVCVCDRRDLALCVWVFSLQPHDV